MYRYVPKNAVVLYIHTVKVRMANVILLITGQVIELIDMSRVLVVHMQISGLYSVNSNPAESLLMTRSESSFLKHLTTEE